MATLYPRVSPIILNESSLVYYRIGGFKSAREDARKRILRRAEAGRDALVDDFRTLPVGQILAISRKRAVFS